MAEKSQVTTKRGKGKPFPKGVTGNPGGRPKRTAEEMDLIAACKERTPEALKVIEGLMVGAASDSVRLNSAIYIIDRAYGKATQFIDAKITTMSDMEDSELDKVISQKAREAGVTLQ
mgnify:CR=1 FL=1